MFDDINSADLISQHRSLNKLSGAKSHLATPVDKRQKLAIKTEMQRRASAGDQDCLEYLRRGDEPPTALVEPARPKPRRDGGAAAELQFDMAAE